MTAPVLTETHIGPHAMVRWIERVEGIDTAAARKQLRIRDGEPGEDRRLLDYLSLSEIADLDAIRRKIAGPDLDEAVRLKRASFKRGEVTFVLRGGRIATIYGPGQSINRHHPVNFKRHSINREEIDKIIHRKRLGQRKKRRK
jgi:hypothetical protein